MKSIFLTFFTFVVLLLLCACGASEPIAPTLIPTYPPTSTWTPNPTSTYTPSVTSSPTLTQTATEIPFTPTATVEPGVVTGTIYLVSEDDAPFQTIVELRKPSSFTLYNRTKSGPDGTFRFTNVASGSYEVWVLLNNLPAPIAGCSDISVDNPDWRLGVKFGEDKAMTMEKGTLARVILLIENLDSPGLNATGFYAVTDIEVGDAVGAITISRITCL